MRVMSKKGPISEEYEQKGDTYIGRVIARKVDIEWMQADIKRKFNNLFDHQDSVATMIGCDIKESKFRKNKKPGNAIHQEQHSPRDFGRGRGSFRGQRGPRGGRGRGQSPGRGRGRG